MRGTKLIEDLLLSDYFGLLLSCTFIHSENKTRDPLWTATEELKEYHAKSEENKLQKYMVEKESRTLSALYLPRSMSYSGVPHCHFRDVNDRVLSSPFELKTAAHAD
jgi:hypothetical protein